MLQQIYEDYWSLTNAFTNYKLGGKFYQTLRICVEFIDEYSSEPYNEEKYRRLQLTINEVLPKNLASIRKSINQLIKLGFINTYLTSHHPLTKDFLNSNSERKAKTVFSKIVYSGFSADRSVTKRNDINNLNYLVRTLIEFGKLSKEEVTGLMLVDISDSFNNILSYEELQQYVNQAVEMGFYERKYNQVDHFWNLLGKLEDLVVIDNVLYFEEDAQRIFGEDLQLVVRRRDPYLHRLYKNQLQEECEDKYGKVQCVLEKLSYPVLIASHIKPFIYSDENEAYDPNNGLLLSRTIDSLFDLKYISFSDDGHMLFSKRISDDVKEFWKDYKLDDRILNEERKSFLSYHRQMVLEIDSRV